VHTEPVLGAMAANLLGIKSKLLGVAHKVAPRVAFLTDAEAIDNIISIEVEQVLEDLADPKRLVEGCI